jgi:lantibiotic leader peptide-processing serine protease
MEAIAQRRRGGLARRIAAFGVAVLVAAAIASQAEAARYVVLYKQEGVASDAAATIKRAGGSLVASYPQIGVVIAESDVASFANSLSNDSRVEGAASTAGFGVEVEDESLGASAAPEGEIQNFPVNDSAEPLFPLQWNMRQIHTSEAHAITGGSPEVLVGDIDSGIDFTHPDLAPNVDFANSVDCSSGAPDQNPAAWFDLNGHGTATAGIIAAAANGVGIVGVAPNVRIAVIKGGSDLGFVFPEGVICSFMWAATHGVDVTNNSYFADPWYFNCRNDAEQRAIWTAERRAIKFAMRQGVTVVAAAANFADDLAHPTRDIISPDFPPGSAEERRIRNDCAVIPVEVPGVIGVSADGARQIKAFYSNYGSGVIQVTAPSTDRRLQSTPDFPNGRVVSTFPGGYGFFGGTSAATPHVTGVAALVQSRFGPMSPGRVAAVIDQTADPIACPDAATVALYAPFPQFSNGEPQSCQGGAGYNSWYGHGQVNAFRAVTHQP